MTYRVCESERTLERADVCIEQLSDSMTSEAWDPFRVAAGAVMFGSADQLHVFLSPAPETKRAQLHRTTEAARALRIDVRKKQLLRC